MSAAANPLLAHTWGVSPASDFIWAEITGRAPSGKPWERPVMVLHAYFDDSDSHDPKERKTYVLGGYIATPEAWASFAAEWEAALEAFDVPRGESGRRRFKMNEMARRMEDVRPFYETIVRHVLGVVSVVIYEDDLERARARVWSDNYELRFTPDDEGRNLIKKILIIQLYRLMDDPSILLVSGENPKFGEMLKANRDRIEVYFDKDESASWVTDWWETLMSGPDGRDLEVYGTREPQFVNDEEYLPLQAADFWAWWARIALQKSGDLGEIVSGNFGSWSGSKGPPSLVMRVNEDALTDYFIELFLGSVPIRSSINVYDAKKKPPTEHAMYVGKLETRSQMLAHFKWLVRRLRGR